MPDPMRTVFVLSLLLCAFLFLTGAFAQRPDNAELNIDLNSAPAPLPKIFSPGIDLSGRGSHRDASWPQSLASPQALNAWESGVGFKGLYRMQYNLWEINESAKDSNLQEKLLAHYEEVIKKVSDAGGTVILDLFGTPAGLGKVLDKKSPPRDMKAFKALIKEHMRRLSCEKKYRVWYEVWSAPDLDDFFLGRDQEYLALYRAVAETVKELEAETGIHIPVGGPSVSWWFKNLQENTVATPERSLIYQLIKFCYRYRLPLDFVSWHSYSTDPLVDKETTIYQKTAVALIRDWLSYFNFDSTVLVVDEWNYDSGANLLSERHERSFICASYLLARMKNMNEAGIDYQTVFSLEDFRFPKEGVVRNVGIFWFDSEFSEYKGGPKTPFCLYKIFAGLRGGTYIPVTGPADECVGAIAVKSADSLTLLVYNYIDPALGANVISRAIASLNPAERKLLLSLIREEKLEGILSRTIDLRKVKATHRMRNLLKKAQDLQDKYARYATGERQVQINLKNLKKEHAWYQRYSLDSSCVLYCEPALLEEKEISVSAGSCKETVSLKPYSVTVIVLKNKPVVEPPPQPPAAAPAVETRKEEPAPAGQNATVAPHTEASNATVTGQQAAP